MKPRPRWKRWLLRGFALSVLLAAGLVIFGFAVVNTGWGRRMTATLASQLASSWLNGRVDVGALDGRVTSEFTLRDVTVRDPTDAILLDVAAIRIRYGVDGLSPVSLRVELAQAEVRALSLARDESGALRLANLLPPSAPDEPKSEPPRFRIAFDDVGVRIARVLGDDRLPESTVVATARGSWLEGRLRLQRTSAAVNGRRVLLARADLDSSSQLVSIAADAIIPVELGKSLQLESVLPLPLIVSATVARSESGLWASRARGSIGRAPFSVALHGHRERVLTLTATASALFVAGQDLGDISLSASANARGRRLRVRARQSTQAQIGVPEVQAELRLADGLRSAEVEIQRLILRTRQVEWTTDPTLVRLELPHAASTEGLVLRSAAGRLKLSGRFDLIRPFRESEEGRLHVEALDLSSLSNLFPGTPKLAGEVSASVFLNRQSGRFSLDGRRIAWGAAAPLTVAATGTIAGNILDAKASFRGERLGSGTAAGRAQLPDVLLSAREWGGSVLERIESVSLVLQRLSMSEAGVVAGIPELQGGDVAGDLSIGRKGKSFVADLEGRALRISALASPFDLKLQLRADDAHTNGRFVSVFADGRGLRADFDINASLRALESQGLTVLGTADGTVDLELDRIGLGPLVAVIQTGTAAVGQIAARGTVPFEGFIEGSASLQKTGSVVRGTVDVAADGVRMEPGLPAISGTLTGHLVPDDLGFDLRIQGPPTPGARRMQFAARADLAPPSDVLVPSAWSALGLNALESVTASAANADLRVLGSLAGLELPAGALELDLRAGRGLQNPKATAALRGVRVATHLMPADVELDLADTTNGASLGVRLSVEGNPLVLGRINAKEHVQRLLSGEVKDVERMRVRGWLTTTDFQIPRLFDDPELRARMGGALRGTLAIAGSWAAPSLKADYEINGARVAKTRFSRFILGGEADRDSAAINIDVGATPGSLQAMAMAHGGALKNVELSAKDFPVDFVSELFAAFKNPVVQFAEARIDGALNYDGVDASGALEVRAEEVAAAPGLPGLEQVVATAEIAKRQWTLRTVGKMGEGDLELLAAGDFSEFSGTASAKDVRVATGPTAAVSSIAVALSGKMDAAGLAVDVRATEGRILLPGDAGRGSLHPIEEMPDVVFVDRAGALAAARRERRSEAGGLPVVIAFKTDEPIRVEGETISSALEADLSVRLTDKGPVVEGLLELEAGGDITIVSHKYDVERARLRFGGQIPIDPRLDVLLTKSFDTLEFRVALRGSAERPELILTSNPATLTRGELMSIFLGAEPGAEGGGDPGAADAVSAAAGLILGPISDALRRTLPLDTIKLDVGTGEDQTNTAALTLGKWLTDSLFVAYTYQFSGESAAGAGEGLVRYRFSGSWIAEVRYAQGEKGAAEILWVKRF